ncbi:MAG: Gfo/Idh/MocA family protein [Rhabdochlamydiaceae bacterium]
MNKLKVGIVGLGKQSLREHLPGILGSEQAQLAAICDINKQKVAELSEKLNVPGYVDYAEMFSKSRPDFAIVAVPHFSYKPIIEAACKEGISILKEKPFALNLDEALYFKRLAQESKIKIMTAVQRRFDPLYMVFNDLKNQIGKVFLIEGRQTIIVDPSEGWRADKKRAGGGVLLDLGYHMIDVLIWNFGLPNSVHAQISGAAAPNAGYNVEDTAIVVFNYGKGLNGTLTLSRCQAPKKEEFKITASHGQVETNGVEVKRMRREGSIAEIIRKECLLPSAATAQIEYFSQVVRGESANISSPDVHLQHAAFIEACYNSNEQGKYVSPADLLKSKMKNMELSVLNR